MVMAFGHCFRGPMGTEASLWGNSRETTSPDLPEAFSVLALKADPRKLAL
jgi:hypothetical protein